MNINELPTNTPRTYTAEETAEHLARAERDIATALAPLVEATAWDDSEPFNPMTVLDPPTALEIVRDVYADSDVDGLTCRLDGDQVTALLEVGAEFFAIGEEYTDGEIDGYSWAWGERTDLDSAMFGDADYFGEDGGTTESEARQAIATWLARFAR